MSLNFSANQYNKAFSPYNLQNWEIPREHKERPIQHDGFTQFIANDQGHLMEGVKRSRESPWGNFVGTWDLPLKIPGNKISNPTARRSTVAVDLQQQKCEGDEIISGQTKHVEVPDALPIKEDQTADLAVTSRSPAPGCMIHSPAQAGPASQRAFSTCPVHPPTKAPSPDVNLQDANQSKSPINWPSNNADTE
ncbi:protein Flattop homolog [Liolophura sinensis]|uniref:protein Flattop homolog n=1 Tax=Liolophura sinensis TaxID=3198878 RepID=UPI0031597A1D